MNHAGLPRFRTPAMMSHPMEFDCLAPNELPRVSRLYSAYLDGAKKLSEFYAYPPTLAAIVRAARELKRGKYYSRETRSAVADILADQNQGFAAGPLPVAVERNLASLREGAVAVVTGQQAGLFGGPAYTFYKALSALRVVGELHQRGVEAVPVFWIASEDHDLAEVNHCDWLSRSGLAAAGVGFALKRHAGAQRGPHQARRRNLRDGEGSHATARGSLL